MVIVVVVVVVEMCIILNDTSKTLFFLFFIQAIMLWCAISLQRHQTKRQLVIDFRT